MNTLLIGLAGPLLLKLAEKLIDALLMRFGLAPLSALEEKEKWNERAIESTVEALRDIDGSGVVVDVADGLQARDAGNP